jgi:hypothetical protein
MCEWGGNYRNMWVCACRRQCALFVLRAARVLITKAVSHQAKHSSGSSYLNSIVMVLWVIRNRHVGLRLVSVDMWRDGVETRFVFGAMSLRSAMSRIQQLRGGLWSTVWKGWADTTSGELVPCWYAYLAAAFCWRLHGCVAWFSHSSGVCNCVWIQYDWLGKQCMVIYDWFTLVA